MLFGIDVRREICKRHNKWENLIGISSAINRMKDDETSEAIKVQMEHIIESLDELIDLEGKEMIATIDKFEKEFASDVLENEDFYRARLEIN